MPESLRPLSLSELLDRAIQLYRKHFGLFVGIAAIPFVAVTALQVLEATLGLTTKPGTTPAALLAEWPRILVSLAVLECVAFLAVAYSMGATVWAVGHLQLGEATSIGRSFRGMKGRVARVALTMLAELVAAMLPMLALFVLAVLLPAVARAGRVVGIIWGLLVFAAAIAAIVAAVWIWLRLAVAVPAVVLEDVGVFAALRRSAALAKGYLGRVFLVYLLTFALELGMEGLLAVPALIIGGLRHPATGVWQVWSLGMGFLANVLVMPILAICLSLLFYDFKVRKEAFDIEVLLRRDAANAQA